MIRTLRRREHLGAGLRQLLCPREFRIPKQAMSVDILSLIHSLAQLRRLEAGGAKESPQLDHDFIPLLRDVGIGLWRLRQKMLEPGTEKPIEEMRRPYRHLQSVWDALTDAGVEILDHTGSPFDSGLALNALAFQPVPNLERQRILETVKPSIYYKKQRIQMGEVIVGTPE
jgi:hypothetical protein